MTGEDFWLFFKNVILCKCVSAFLLYVYKTFCICRAGGTYARSDIFAERLEVPVTYKNSHT